MAIWTTIGQHLTSVTGQSLGDVEPRSVGGGCINQGYCLQGQHGQRYFVKLNRASLGEMFEAEALGLQAMAQVGAIRVPLPICWGTESTSAYLVLEWLDLGRAHEQAWYAMGQGLAQLHRRGTSQQGFGWHRNNTIGSTPQINTWTDDWLGFWREHRLGYQLQLAQRRGGRFPKAQELLGALPIILGDRPPQPSLVHGDLWGGNGAVLVTGEPVIFDPAVYYGDREVDLAMTELFGGFPTAFYQGYNAEWPLDEGYNQRKTLYNLYHLLNHFNLFGGSYEASANSAIDRLLRP